MPTFNTIEALQEHIEKVVKESMVIANQVLKEVVQLHIKEDFYDLYPKTKSYDRSWDLLERVPISIRPEMVGNKIVCGVYLEPNQLRQDGYHHQLDQDLILKYALKGWHGSKEIDTKIKFLEEALKDLVKNQQFTKALAKEMRARGLDVRF